jgi:hypothetical protein
MDNDVAAWIVVILGVLAFGGLVYWLNDMFSRARMMRCPETGSVTFVRVTPAAGGAGNASEVTVRQCDLWPKRKDCAQGCLARYQETTPGWRGNLNALRPIEPQLDAIQAGPHPARDGVSELRKNGV